MSINITENVYKLTILI